MYTTNKIMSKIYIRVIFFANFCNKNQEKFPYFSYVILADKRIGVDVKTRSQQKLIIPEEVVALLFDYLIPLLPNRYHSSPNNINKGRDIFTNKDKA